VFGLKNAGLSKTASFLFSKDISTLTGSRNKDRIKMLSRQEAKEQLHRHTQAIKENLLEIYGKSIDDIDFSCIELFTTLFYSEMKHDPHNPSMNNRDRLVVSNLSAIPSLLAVLADAGYITWKEFQELLLGMSRFFTNPNLAMVNYPGVDFITGSPYLGLVQSIGYAVTGRRARHQYRVYHVSGDKRTVAIQEALMSATESRMTNLKCIVPFLDYQRRVASMQFWFSMGWQLEEVRFDDVKSVYEGFYRASGAKMKPQVLLG
jgi:transketolase